jgi:hypothetical protein
MLDETGGSLPDTFLVYQVISSPPALHADQVEKIRWYRMQVTVYARGGLASVPDLVAAAMVAAGFSKSVFRELPYNPDTRHFGYAMEFIWMEDE